MESTDTGIAVLKSNESSAQLLSVPFYYRIAELWTPHRTTHSPTESYSEGQWEDFSVLLANKTHNHRRGCRCGAMVTSKSTSPTRPLHPTVGNSVKPVHHFRSLMPARSNLARLTRWMSASRVPSLSYAVDYTRPLETQRVPHRPNSPWF